MNAELRTLKNVGKATEQGLTLLGITTIEQLKHQDPDDLYEPIQKITGTKHDSCVWDVFAAIIHEAKTGEKLSWWHFSNIKKQDQNQKFEPYTFSKFIDTPPSTFCGQHHFLL